MLGILRRRAARRLMADPNAHVDVPLWVQVALAVVVAFTVFLVGAGLLELIVEHVP